MRIKLNFDLENEFLSIQYRKSVMSFIKLSLSEYDEQYYRKFYHDKDTIIKPYTFSVFFRNPKFNEDTIFIKDKSMTLNISIADYETAIILYNAFNHQKNKRFPLDKNSWTLKNITTTFDKKIDSEEIVIKFMSPLVVRSHLDKKDYYYSYNNEEFKDMLKINIKQQLKITNLSEELVDNFDIVPVKAKKVIVKFYEKKIETSTGIFKISGNEQLLKYLYDAGIGSKRSSGFGMFQIV